MSYIIINSDTLQKRIEELKNDPIFEIIQNNIKTHNRHSPQEEKKASLLIARINVAEHAKAWVDTDGEWTSSNVEAKVLRNSIINAPSIELK